MTTFVYPSDPLKRSSVEILFEDESLALKARGHQVVVIKIDEGKLITKGQTIEGETLVYRGWMLNQAEYVAMTSAVIMHKAKPLHTFEQFLECHHLPNWYNSLSDLTPETVFLPKDADLELELARLAWGKYVIKDYVKALKTSAGHIVTDPSQAPVIAADMLKYRGLIEGGFSIRRFEPIDPASERRYFVIDGKSFSSDGTAPSIVEEVARRISSQSKFFSVDIAMRDDGQLRVIEIGDGQVSGLAEWSPKRFAEIW